MSRRMTIAPLVLSSTLGGHQLPQCVVDPVLPAGTVFLEMIEHRPVDADRDKLTDIWAVDGSRGGAAGFLTGLKAASAAANGFVGRRGGVAIRLTLIEDDSCLTQAARKTPQ